MQVSVFEQYSVIYLFLKLLYFLHSHCQLSPEISVEFRTWGVLLLCITSDKTCLWVEVCEWKASGTVRVSVLLRGYHSCKPSTCGMVSSYCHATLLYVLSNTIHYFREMKLFMYLFICFIFICCCFVCPNLDYPFRCSAAEHLDLTCVFFMLCFNLMTLWPETWKWLKEAKEKHWKCKSRCISVRCHVPHNSIEICWQRCNIKSVKSRKKTLKIFSSFINRDGSSVDTIKDTCVIRCRGLICGKHYTRDPHVWRYIQLKNTTYVITKKNCHVLINPAVIFLCMKSVLFVDYYSCKASSVFLSGGCHVSLDFFFFLNWIEFPKAAAMHHSF